MGLCQRYAIGAAAALAATVIAHPDRGIWAQSIGETKLTCDASPCDSVARGRVAFNRDSRELGGNGRACADCHVP